MLTHRNTGTGRLPVFHSWTVGGLTPTNSASAESPPTTDAALSMGDVFSIPPLLGNTYKKIKALPKYFYKCLIPAMENRVHMGKKLQCIAEERRLKPKDVAVFFGIKPPSVYDWYEHGRIAKKHYDKLVEFSGKPITWWLDMGGPTAKHAVKEPASELFSVPSGDPWPFGLFTQSQWFALSDTDRQNFENMIAGAILRAQKTAEQS